MDEITKKDLQFIAVEIAVVAIVVVAIWAIVPM